MAAEKSYRISVYGIVQGVGFRPFVYRLAHQLNLKGWVCNTSGSVDIEIKGNEKSCSLFVQNLSSNSPAMAKIFKISTEEIPLTDYEYFEIRKSVSSENQLQLIPPDIAMCDDCREDILSESDRHHLYPFTNCTNCGPRFTIIKNIPYDRIQTTMSSFTMCPNCQKEYDDPLNRRFHAQPNACPVCGPNLELQNNLGTTIPCSDVILKASELLKGGFILAIKSLGGFQLVCDATNSEIIQKLRLRKKRKDKPFAIMIESIDKIKQICYVSEEEEILLKSPISPIVLLEKKLSESHISSLVGPNLKFLGVMLPYTPFHYLLLNETSLPLVMTSGNLSEEPISFKNEDAFLKLRDIADFFIFHNRDILLSCDDSVCSVDNKKTFVIRRSRGYAPNPINLPFSIEKVLGLGSEEKNTFCLTIDNSAFISQHIGSMENLETMEYYENSLSHFKKLFRIEPTIIAYDMHPEYMISKYVDKLKKQNLPHVKFIPIQHHHAHIASCMAENNLEQPVIGVAFDGSGYGLDGNIWGGEFFTGTYSHFIRTAHLKNICLPGNEQAIRNPFYMALSYLYEVFGKEIFWKDLPISKWLNAEKFDIILHLIETKINSPFTSSMGRLFDAVAALCGIGGIVSYEAQAAIELEMHVLDECEWKKMNPYPFQIENNDCLIINVGDVFLGIVGDLLFGESIQKISTRFHKTVSQIITDTCQQIQTKTNLKSVVLSGGTFQNRVLTKMTSEQLKEKGFTVYTHHLVPCNDGGLSLGQAVIGSFTKKGE